MTAPADLLTDALATHRLVRLAQRDTITDGARHRIQDYLHERHPQLEELLFCPWCLSIHVAAGAVAARALVPRAWSPLAALLAISSVVGLISEREHG